MSGSSSESTQAEASESAGPTRAVRPRGGIGRIWRLARKELRETLRDRRTLATLILMPLILYPLLSLAFQRFLVASYLASTSGVYKVGIEEEVDSEVIRELYERGDWLLGIDQQTARGTVGDESAAEQASSNAAIASPKTRWRVEWFVAENVRQRVANMDLDIGIVTSRNWGDGNQLGRQPLFELIYRDQSVMSQGALLYVESRLRTAADERLVAWQARRPGRPPVVTIGHATVEPEGAGGGVSLAALVPLILVLTTITGAVYPAIDLTAGERERGTLETLIASPVPRLSLLLAKYTAVVTVAMLTASVNLAAMTITLQAAGLTPLLFGPEGLPLRAIAVVFLLLILFACFFSAVLLALTSFARSFKEAQAYLVPLMLLSIAPGLLSLMPSVTLTGPWMIAPLVNMVLLARDVFAGTAAIAPAAVAIVSTLLYAFAALGLAARMFGDDAVLYGQQQSWTEWLRRPNEPRSATTTAAAFGCLALVFPAYIVTSGLLAQWPFPNAATKIAASGLATLLLFAGLPWLALWHGRVRLRNGFQLRLAPWPSFIAAVILGLSSWALAHEIVVWRAQTGGETSLPREQLEALLKSWRTAPAWLIVAALAIAPACGEELFFRGYLLGAMRNRWRPATAILASAVLFGLFHLITTQMLAAERFITSASLGVLLGWVCYRTRSVWPGIVLHACNNTLLLLAAYYRDVLEARGWRWLQQEHLPRGLIALAAVAFLIGVTIIWWSCRRGTSAEPALNLSLSANQDSHVDRDHQP
ncbi:MAG: CPBP family intramembrane metalloprotease [Planctomycetales bacterium]|nr:CPBP family intramembrane metalloprotease [Planctomycetales bacterium]